MFCNKRWSIYKNSISYALHDKAVETRKHSSRMHITHFPSFLVPVREGVGQTPFPLHVYPLPPGSDPLLLRCRPPPLDEDLLPWMQTPSPGHVACDECWEANPSWMLVMSPVIHARKPSPPSPSTDKHL